MTPRCSPQPHAGALRHAAAHNTDRLEQELKRLRRYKLLVMDEFGYLAFDHDAANLFFQLVAARYDRAPEAPRGPNRAHRTDDTAVPRFHPQPRMGDLAHSLVIRR